MSIVLLGKIGAGKTTLYNKITLSQEIVKYGGDSVTQNVFMKKSSFGKGFQILDTPGFGTQSKKIDQIASVLCALSEGPISRICITVKFARTDIIIDDIKTILQTFHKFRHLITVIVTFWDYCEKAEKEANTKNIQQRLNKYKINSVIFVSKNDKPESICQQLDQIIAQSQAQNVQLDDQDIYENFDMIEYDDAMIQEINYSSQQYYDYYRKFYNQAMYRIENNKISSGNQADYCNAITRFAKETIDETMKKFEKDKQEKIDKLSENQQFKAFQIYFQLKSQLFKDYQYIVKAAEKKINNGKEFSKYIKKCNHCHEIWFKVDGCTGQTVCGRLNEKHVDKFIQKEEAPQEFIVTYIGEMLEVKPNQFKKLNSIVLKQQNLMTNEEKANIEKISLGIFEKAKVGGVGCRKKIYWEQMLPLTEEELTEILGILDEQFYQEMVDFEKEVRKQKINQLNVYKGELEEKIKEQKLKIKKVT